MKILYLLTERDSDALIYEAFAERITGFAFTPVCRRMRKGSGLGAVRASLRLALAEANRMAESSGVHLLIGMDNDRAPHQTASDALSNLERARLAKAERQKTDRYAALVAALEHSSSSQKSAIQIPAAVAVPVEMLESWLLLIETGGWHTALPRHARQDSDSARKGYYPSAPPPQLKDLCDSAAEENEFTSTTEWAFQTVMEKLDAEDLGRRSPSFELFKRWLDRWPKPLVTS